MTTKEWLNRGRKLDEEINQLIQAQEKAFAQATYTVGGTEGDKVQTSRKNVSENRFVNYASYSEMIDNRIDELYLIKQEILQAVNRLGDGVFRTLLVARYINFKTWEQIAVEMNYSWSQTHRLHGKALKKMEGIISPPNMH